MSNGTLAQSLAPEGGATFFGHPRGLMTLFFTEMWERFSYYGMRAILLLFMVEAAAKGGLGFSADSAGPIYAMYTSMVYLVSVPGGWLADNFLGPRRAVLYGGIVIMTGHILLALIGTATFFAGLGCIVIGTGLLKPNISVIVGQLYSEEDRRRDAGFSIFYMGINIGAFAAPLLCGFLAQHDIFRGWLEAQGFDPNHSWHWGFGLAAVGMFFGLVQYLLSAHHLGEAGLKPNAPEDPVKRAKNRRTLTIGLVGTMALAVGLFTFDRSASYAESITWSPAEGGLEIECYGVHLEGAYSPMHDKVLVANGDLEAHLGVGGFEALQEAVFADRLAAGEAKGSLDDVFFRVDRTIGTGEAAITEEVAVRSLRWEPAAEGVRVFGALEGTDGAETELGVIPAGFIRDDLPDSLAPVLGDMLGEMLDKSIEAGTAVGAVPTGLEVKHGGLNEDNIHDGFTYALLALVVLFFGKLFVIEKWTRAERARLIVITVLFCGAAIFWGIFEQAGSTLTLFADRSTNNSLFGFQFPASWWQSLNPLLIVCIAPLMGMLWLRLGKRNPSYPFKFAVGLLLAGVGFLVLVGGAFLAKNGMRVSPLWLLSVYVIHTIGELWLSPVGLSSMTKLAPVRVVSLMMGVWFLAASVGNFIGGSVSGLYEDFETPTLFTFVGASGVLMAVVMLLLVKPIAKMLKQVAAEEAAQEA
ncbi:MAG: MFS transporter [Planctomycetes bacterium]|nr:MFS transporter [Planctomycetota bacterium]MBL7009336.1 MFS transporter [Planctomycetota bacterium]